MPAPVMTGDILAAGLLDRFKETWNLETPNYSWLSKVMDLGIPATTRTLTFGSIQTTPYLSFKPDAQATSGENMDAGSFSVTVKEFEKYIGWRIKDRQDERTGSLPTMVEGLARHAKIHPLRVLAAFIAGTATIDVIDAIPTAPDGGAAYATTVGGVNRYGRSSGNLLTGSGVSTDDQVRTDASAGMTQFAGFLDKKSQPLWGAEVFMQEIFVLYNPDNEIVFRKAFLNAVIASTAGGAGAGVTNPMLGYPFKLQPFPYFTDNDWTMHLSGAPIKAFFQAERIPLYTMYEVEENSDRARSLGEERFYAKARWAFGVNEGYSTLKIDNA